jgi:DNA-binding NarL/FixJ family response regulator
MDVTCIIVDDNNRFLDAARTVLEEDGITVLGVASTGAEAMVRVDELRPDITLIDICLGEESGLSLADRIATRSDGHRTAIVLISTYPASDLDEMTQGCSAEAFLPKSDLSGRAIRAILDGTGC